MQCAEEKDQDEDGGKLISNNKEYNNWSNTENNINCNKMSVSKGPIAIPFMEDIQENDFIQDAPEYQWFAEYGYRDSMNCTSSQILRSSILSSLCSSYTYNDLECYNDMARDLDVNLAQIDMEDFKTEDIHSILHPHISDIRHNGNELSESLGKSEIQFSPVKEIPLVSFSTDSLDCQDQDIMLTCQANKDNYTIAFEGSTIMATSRESQYQTANNTFSSTCSSSKESEGKTTSSESISKNNDICSNLIRSESPYTTWRKLKQNPSENLLKQNSSEKISSSSVTKLPSSLSKSYAFVKCQSLPNLKNTKVSSSFHQTMMNSINNSVDTKKDGCVKVYDVSNSKIRRKIHNSIFQNGVNFNLISRFISNKHEKGNSQTELGSEEDKGEQKCNNDSTNLLADSFSSFSSHSGGYERQEVTKRNGNKSDDESRRVQHILVDRRSKRLMGNYYFSSDKTSIMDRSIQTSLIQSKQYVGKEENKLKEKQNTEKLEPSGEEGGKKPVYVMYPNYTLPDLTFLRDHAAELDLDNVFLWPQQFSLSPMIENRSKNVKQCKKAQTKRPCSCPEFESIRKGDFKHIEDWESILFLLPREYHELLVKIPEMAEILKDKLFENAGHSLMCTSDIKTRRQESSHQRTECSKANTGVSCSSTATQPSSGYRGSSTLLTDSSSSSNPLYVYKYESNDGSTKPPVPRGILRNPAVQNIKSKNGQNSKRYSMFEMRNEKRANPEKRRSLPSQISIVSQQKSLREEDEYYCSEDEGVESASSHCESPGPDAKRLEQLLEGSVHWDQQDITHLRDQVSRCLSQVGRKTVSFADRTGNTPPNSPNGSLSSHKCTNQVKSPWSLDLAISEECELGKQSSSCEHSADQCTNSFVYKKDMLESAVEACNRLLVSFDEADDAVVAQVALNTLCPALYAILNHGLKNNIETAFGDINNSVWQIVEASAQHGPMTKALHELVLRLNSEDVLNEGLLKFNAFIFGLLNVQALDAWFSYLRTRESILRKHYTDGGLLLSSAKGISSDRHLVDHLINTLKPLAEYPFKLDLLYECKQLHESLMQIARSPESPIERSNTNRTSWMLKKIVRSLQSVASANDTTRTQNNEGNRPRSCVDSSSGFNFNDIASTVRKRWSGIQIGSKLASAFDKYVVDDDEEYTDSLEHNRKGYDQSVTEINDAFSEIESEENITRKNDGKFKRLQKKWEMLAERELVDSCQTQNTSPTSICDTSYTISKSRIPRPVTSPVKPSSLNFTVASPNTKCKKSPSSPSGIPMFIAKKLSPTSVGNNKPVKNVKQRASRIDKNYCSNAAPRPGSLPERKQHRLNNDKRQSSLNRNPSVAQTSSHRYVRSLKHRLASDNGHLTFNEGEKLRVIFDVDDKWILCSRGDQKGLVPRRLVLPVTNNS